MHVKKYVDDLILTVAADKCDSLQNTFNGYSQHIQFTFEKENNRCLAFLDTIDVRYSTGKLPSCCNGSLERGIKTTSHKTRDTC